MDKDILEIFHEAQEKPYQVKNGRCPECGGVFEFNECQECGHKIVYKN